MTIDQALDILRLDKPTTRKRIKQPYRTLAKEFHPDRYYKSGVSDAWATQKFIQIKDAYDLLMSPESADAIIAETGFSTENATREVHISATEHAEPFDEEKVTGVSIISWLFDRLRGISGKWKMAEKLLDAVLVWFVLPCVIPVVVLGFLTYGLVYFFMQQIMRPKSGRSFQIITRIVLILEFSSILIYGYYELTHPTIFAYLTGCFTVFSISLLIVDLGGYILSSLWKRSMVTYLNEILPMTNSLGGAIDE